MKIIIDAMQQHPQGGFALHPLWQPQAAMLRRHYQVRWFDAPKGDALSWYSWLCDAPLAALLAGDALPRDGEQQVWLASPYHAQLARDAFHLTSFTELTWSAEDAAMMVERLNPVLAAYGMRLAANGAGLLLFSRHQLYATPPSLADVSISGLPNRTIPGNDGMLLMRVMAEIQTQLFQYPLTAQALPVSGLWLWAAQPLPLSGATALPVASNHALLPACKQASLQLLHMDHQVQVEDGDDVMVLAALNEACAALLTRRSPLARLFSLTAAADQPWQAAEPLQADQLLRQYILQYA